VSDLPHSPNRARRPKVSEEPSAQSTFTALFLRCWWLLLGNGVLFLVLVFMALEREQFPSLLDVVFALLVASLISARLADIRYFRGRTAEGARASMEHFRRYLVRLLTSSAAGWGVANSLALL